MSDKQIFENFDLRLLPDWLKEDPSPSRHKGSSFSEDLSDAGRSAGDDARPAYQEDQRRKDRSRKRPSDPERHKPQARGHQRHREDPKTPARSSEGERRPHGQALRKNRLRHSHPTVAQQINVKISFKPEPQFVENVLPKLKQTLVTFPLYKLASMFLAEPTRHRVVLKRKQPGCAGFLTTHDRLFVLMDDTPREQVEQVAFKALAHKFYRTEKIIGPEIRGNFRSVAVCRLTGEVIGPSNHHSYPFTLKRIYEERFSRRMSFERFKESIIQATDEETLNKWKEQVRYKIVWHPIPCPNPDTGTPLTPTSHLADNDVSAEQPSAPAVAEQFVPIQKQPPPEEALCPELPQDQEEPPQPDAAPAIEQPAAPPEQNALPAEQSNAIGDGAASLKSQTLQNPIFESEAAVRRDFIENHLPKLLVRCDEVELTGPQARSVVSGPLLHALRRAFEAESRFPETLARALAEEAHEMGLSVFKLDKKVVCVAAVHPVVVDPDSPLLADGVAAILKVVRSKPACRRSDVAEELLGSVEPPSDAETDAQREAWEKRRAAFLKDLRFALSAGFIVELNDGTLHLITQSRHSSVERSEPTSSNQIASLTRALEALSDQGSFARIEAQIAPQPGPTSDPASATAPVPTEEQV